ncbi:hypothetical protein SAMN05216326_1733 [Nitrosomonas marina]|uniref:Helix-turn-helix domain-containing protein n=1 Tax=Nitrosomonas marina TaxID=917 RepID=A0A1I0GIX0_9PROT|nr:helix-turn-helix domain-containing protein [Nitrosomonas marina]SET70073.1 hypothetical protein SAMN05216326_1733 [Nitrosomonas marina]
MKKRLYNPHLAKIHRSYTIEEAASLYGVFKGTVRAWIKAGLPVINDKRPMLILGSDLVAFHQARRKKNKQKCKPDELYCVRCRTPRKPAGKMVDYQIITDKIGNLIAICPDCESIMNKRISLLKLEQLTGKITITLPQALQHLIDNHQHSVNSDLKQE